MAETTIEWTATRLPDGTLLPGFTMNPWVGCTKVSPSCDHCYAESWAKRTGHPELWTGERRRTTPENWRKPLKWNKEAYASGIRRKVFCASLADVFDNQAPIKWLVDLLDLISGTPHLDWLLLTKRPQNIAKRLRAAAEAGAGVVSGFVWQWLDGGNLPANVWLGTTVENQEEADRRIPHLLAVPAAVRFLSCEPLLGPVRLHDLSAENHRTIDALRGESWRWGAEGVRYDLTTGASRLSWIIAGGESGGGKRPMDLAWMRSLRDQCAAVGIPFFGKQIDKVQTIPPDLMVRQFPEPRAWRIANAS